VIAYTCVTFVVIFTDTLTIDGLGLSTKDMLLVLLDGTILL